MLGSSKLSSVSHNYFQTRQTTTSTKHRPHIRMSIRLSISLFITPHPFVVLLSVRHQNIEAPSRLCACRATFFSADAASDVEGSG